MQPYKTWPSCLDWGQLCRVISTPRIPMGPSKSSAENTSRLNSLCPSCFPLFPVTGVDLKTSAVLGSVSVHFPAQTWPWGRESIRLSWALGPLATLTLQTTALKSLLEIRRGRKAVPFSSHWFRKWIKEQRRHLEDWQGTHLKFGGGLWGNHRRQDGSCLAHCLV